MATIIKNNADELVRALGLDPASVVRVKIFIEPGELVVAEVTLLVPEAFGHVLIDKYRLVKDDSAQTGESVE